MALESWVAFILALLVTLAVPGPDLALVLNSATRGAREAASTTLGILGGLTLHTLLAVAGVTALLLSIPGALDIVQVLGAGVLLWMGYSMLRSGLHRSQVASPTAAPRTPTGFVRGFATNATNPKALLFFAAILPQFIGHDEHRTIRTITLCATIILGSGLWWGLTILLVRTCGLQRHAWADRAITLLGGAALLLIGGGLLATAIHHLMTI